MAPKPLQQGDPAQIGRYRLTARLGSGGMGVVYLAHGADGEQIAVKVLRPEYADDGEFRARFQREVAAMARVRNRYTVQVLDANTESAMPFLATQFADGPSLDEHVREQGPLHPEATTRLAAALAEALAAIHAAGVTHRDLKPSNVLLTSQGPMVIDFGIAQVADSVSITRTGMAIGSPGYMAPEQVTGHAGREADIFTWALIVSFAASGQAPFGTGPTVVILQRILNDRPDVSAVPPRLMPLVQAALAKEPRRRPTAADLLRELSPGATAAMGAQTAVAGQTTRDAWDDGYQGAPTRSLGGDSGYGGNTGGQRRWLGTAIAAAVVVVLVVVGVALLANGGSGSGDGTPGARVPGTSTTGPVLSGTKTGTSPTQPAATTQSQAPTDQQTPTGQSTGNGGNTGNQNGGGGNTATSPSASPAASPSTSPSAAASPSPSASASTAPGTSGGTNG